MSHFKVFSSASANDDVAQLERMVNEWIETEHPRIHLVTQSPFGVHLVVSFVYDEPVSGDGSLADATAVPEVFERTMENLDLDPTEPNDTLLPEAELPY